MLRWVCSLIDHRGGHRAVGTSMTHSPAPSVLVLLFLPHYDFVCDLIAELAKRSPIIIQNSSNPSGRKNLDVRPCDRTTVRPYKVLLLTCVVNCTAGTPTPRLFPVVQWSVHWAPSRTTRFLVLAGARCCALETCRKKNASSAFRLAKSIYHRRDPRQIGHCLKPQSMPAREILRMHRSIKEPEPNNNIKCQLWSRL